MMPERSPIHIPAYLRGEADPDTLAGLVEGGRRLGLFWPLLAGSEGKGDAKSEAPQPPRRRPGFRVGPREARLIGGMSEYGG
ncbi:hypothetical protein [Streptacidiphilus rugosus]|uniref:hypothetical protein n=1 Tax=Streptacidiphilus rugosus TaxID=405783 RepID=UPI00055E9804|nr:hypothetical protein [Streptacidiphilus rugosus]